MELLCSENRPFGVEQVIFEVNYELVVYTCVTHGYDRLKPVKPEPGTRYVCFTDHHKVLAEGWESHALCSPKRLNHGHDINRFHKFFPHRLFPSHRYSVYMDGNIEYQSSLINMLNTFRKSGAALGAFVHPDRRSVFEEAEACKQLKKLCRNEWAQLQSQLEMYEASGFDLAAPITANYLLIRDHAHSALSISMAVWWSSLFEFTKRDQLSLSFVLWKTNLPWVLLDEELRVGTKLLERRSHKKSFWRRVERALQRYKRRF